MRQMFGSHPQIGFLKRHLFPLISFCFNVDVGDNFSRTSCHVFIEAMCHLPVWLLSESKGQPWSLAIKGLTSSTLLSLLQFIEEKNSYSGSSFQNWEFEKENCVLVSMRSCQIQPPAPQSSRPSPFVIYFYQVSCSLTFFQYWRLNPGMF